MELLTPEQRIFLKTVCSKPNRWRVNKKTGMIDVDVDVNMNHLELTEIPIKFGRVQGRFSCSYNNLTTLKNCPDWVGGSFDCSRNNLTSLEGFPVFIKGDVYFSDNKLTDYFKSIKEEDFPYWDKLYWSQNLREYPFLINITKKHLSRLYLEYELQSHPHLKLYLE